MPASPTGQNHTSGFPRVPRRRWKWLRRGLLLLLIGILLFILPLRPALVIRQFPVPSQAESVVVAAGAQYRAGPIQRFLMGGRYRDLWTQPITVPILDLESVEGGLRASREGGGMQTRTLHLVSREGHGFVFRSVDKELTRLAPPGLAHSLIVGLLQDQASASHPASVLMAAPLQAAAGLPHTHPRLVVLPDDSLLGAFRSRYAGMLGVFQESPGEIPISQPRQESLPVRSTVEILPLIEASPFERIDAHAFLTARLLDLFLNDWDRHEGQWRWAGRSEDRDTIWEPIPVDRDQAFAWYDGVLIRIVRMKIRKLIPFGAEPDLASLTLNSVRLDGRLLGELTKRDWDSTASWLTAQLTDSVIDYAVRQSPEAYWKISGESLARTLRQRRDRIGSVAGRFYSMLAARAEVHGTNGAEEVDVRVLSPETVSVQVHSLLPGGSRRLQFMRVYRAQETRSIAIHLHGGRDRVMAPGNDRSSIAITLVDSIGHSMPARDGGGESTP
ncbi:MAG: hypothetical protein ABI679_03420 [Gemmatimonadota bacterium]